MLRYFGFLEKDSKGIGRVVTAPDKGTKVCLHCSQSEIRIREVGQPSCALLGLVAERSLGPVPALSRERNRRLPGSLFHTLSLSLGEGIGGVRALRR